MAGEQSALDLVRSGASFREILIDAVEEIGGLWSAAEDDRAINFDQVHGWMSKYEGPIGRWALGAAFEEMGLELDPGEGLNADTITRAINAGPLAGSGLEFSNIFNRQAVIDDLVKFGILRAAQAFGIDASSVGGLRDAVRSELVAEITGQVEAGAGDLLENAGDDPTIARVLLSVPENEGWNAITDTSAAGQSNRDRQARYRAAHTKHWEVRR